MLFIKSAGTENVFYKPDYLNDIRSLILSQNCISLWGLTFINPNLKTPLSYISIDYETQF